MFVVCLGSIFVGFSCGLGGRSQRERERDFVGACGLTMAGQAALMGSTTAGLKLGAPLPCSSSKKTCSKTGTNLDATRSSSKSPFALRFLALRLEIQGFKRVVARG